MSTKTRSNHQLNEKKDTNSEFILVERRMNMRGLGNKAGLFS